MTTSSIATGTITSEHDDGACTDGVAILIAADEASGDSSSSSSGGGGGTGRGDEVDSLSPHPHPCAPAEPVAVGAVAAAAAAAAPPPIMRRRVGVACACSLLALAMVCTAIAGWLSHPVFHVPATRLLRARADRDQLFLQPNTSLWPNVCDDTGTDAELDGGGATNHTVAYRYELAAAMIIRNEAAWIYESIEYHLEVGVQHFFLIDDDSDDDTIAALAQYVDDDVVTLLTMPQLMALPGNQHLRRGPDAYTTRQKAALLTAVEWGRAPETRTEWMLVMDTDERYVVHGAAPCLRSFLASFSPDTGVVYWHWQMFGTSGVERLADDEPMIGALTRKAQPVVDGGGGHFKPAVRPVAVHYFQNTHKPILVPDPRQSAVEDEWGWAHRFTDGRRVRGSFDEAAIISHAQINHYFTRDADFHRRFKIPERQAIAGDTLESHEQLLRGLNQTIDRSAVPFTQAVMRRMHQRRQRYLVRRP